MNKYNFTIDNENKVILPINLHGVFNRVSYLIDWYNTHSKNSIWYVINNSILNNNTNIVEPSNNILYNNSTIIDNIPKFDNYVFILEQLKEYAKNNSMIDTQVMFTNKFTIQDPTEDKYYWYINLILNSLIVNFYNSKELLNKFLKLDTKLTKEGLFYSLNFYCNRLGIKNWKYILNLWIQNYKVDLDTYIENLIENYESKTGNHKLAYKDLDYVIQHCDKYAIEQRYSVRDTNKMTHIHYYGQEQRNRSYKNVLLWNNYNLYLDYDMKIDLYRWFKTNSKDCRKFMRNTFKNIIIQGVKELKKFELNNLFRYCMIYNKEHPELNILDNKEIETIKSNYTNLANTLYKLHKNELEEAKKEVLSTREIYKTSLTKNAPSEQQEMHPDCALESSDNNINIVHSLNENDWRAHINKEENEYNLEQYKDLNNTEFFKRLL